MKRKILLLSIIMSAFFLMILYQFERWSDLKKQTPTMGVSIEDAGKNDFWISVPAIENRGLSYDVGGYFDDETNTIYLILPADVNQKKVVYYVRDIYNNYLTRVVSNFEKEDVMIGDRAIVAIASELPILYLQVDDEYGTIHDVNNDPTKETRCYGELRIDVGKESATQNGFATSYLSVDYDDSTPGSVEVKPRGNNTWLFGSKRPYSFKLDKSMDLLGMGKTKKWALLANAEDKSLIKNEIAFKLADQIGVAYTPQTQNVVFYLNGEYRGVYGLTTRIEIDKDRVALTNNDFLINWGGSAPQQVIPLESESWYYDSSEHDFPYVDLIYPENASDIEAVQTIVQEYMTAVEDVSSDRYLEYMDIESLAKFYWVQEICMNLDASSRSIYSYYKGNEQKLYMGPVWDMDLTLGINGDKAGCDYRVPEGWAVRNIGMYVPLFEHDSFEQEVERVYYEEGIRDIMFAMVDYFDYMQNTMKVDGELNYSRWRDEPGIYALDYGATNYEEQVNGVRQFYVDRIEWIDAQMAQ